MEVINRKRTTVETAEIQEVNAEKRDIEGLSSWGRRGISLGLAITLSFVIVGCHKTSQVQAAQTAADPADANFAPVNGALQQQVQGQSAQNESQKQAQDYGQQTPAPIVRQSPSGSEQPEYANPQTYDNGESGSYDDQDAQAVLNSDLSDEEASEPPPPLPEYEQPPCPDPNYIWTPGYWAWGPEGYYWVPGVWVAAPFTDALWTPGYWAFVGGAYRFHHGYWGPHIGFYGGVDYGFGYVGHGYYGGYWNDGRFYYNTAVSRVNVNVIRNVYVHNVVVNNRVVNDRILNRTSYVGGRGGLQARPMPAEMVAMRGQRFGPMQSQLQVRQDARQDRRQFFNQNHGRPPVAADARPVAADRTMHEMSQQRSAERNGSSREGNQSHGPAQPNAGQVFSEGRVAGGRPSTASRQAQSHTAEPRAQNRTNSTQERGQHTQPQSGEPQQRNAQVQRQAHPQEQRSPQAQSRPGQSQPQYRRGPEHVQSRPQSQQEQMHPQPQSRSQSEAHPAEQHPQSRERQGPSPRPEQGHEENRPH